MSEATVAAPAETTSAAPTVPEQVPAEDVLIEDVLVEEVSIDGMCGVY